MAYILFRNYVKCFKNAQNIINTSAKKKKSLSKIQLTTIIELLNVLVPKCHLQGFFLERMNISPTRVKKHSCVLTNLLMVANW